MILDDDGQPVFGPRDEADLEKVAKVGLPFWLAGGYSTPELVEKAQSLGAFGVQVGSLFALAKETGLTATLRDEMMQNLRDGSLEVRTDPFASPTGFPFKVVSLPDTISTSQSYTQRPRLCDLGYLRIPYERTPGTVGYRCAAEPVHVFIRKGGTVEDALGRKCLCNALMADIGLANTRGTGYTELPLVTLGADLAGINSALERFPHGWGAAEIVDYLMSGVLALRGKSLPS